YDPEKREWFSPTYHPLNDPGAEHLVEFGVDGTATYRMTKGTLETELTVFVPPDEPVGVYVLTIRSRAATPLRLRLAASFQMVLADQPENSGRLSIGYEKALDAVFFENPRNSFRSGPAFVAVSAPVECLETSRGKFFGDERTVAHPALVERGRPLETSNRD